MKKLSLLVCCVLTSLSALAQNQNTQFDFYIMPLQQPYPEVLYYGFNNELAIYVPGVKQDKVKVTANDAVVSKVQDRYIIRPQKQSGEICVSVSAEVNGKTVPKGSMSYSVKLLPPPTIGLETYNHHIYHNLDSIPLEELIHGKPRLILTSNYHHCYDLKGFVMSYSGLSSSSFTDMLTDEMKDILEHEASPFDPITFVNIKYTNFGGSPMQAPGLVFYIKK